jgi:hypothetical protein
MNRLIITARNSDFPRLGARPASNPAPPVLFLPDRATCEAGLSSGATPDAVTGGSRQAARTPISFSPPDRVGVHLARDEKCKDCDGWGERWLSEHLTNPSAKSSWSTCDRCGGDGYEPKHNTEEDEADENE